MHAGSWLFPWRARGVAYTRGWGRCLGWVAGARWRERAFAWLLYCCTHAGVFFGAWYSESPAAPWLILSSFALIALFTYFGRWLLRPFLHLFPEPVAVAEALKVDEQDQDHPIPQVGSPACSGS